LTKLHAKPVLAKSSLEASRNRVANLIAYAWDSFFVIEPGVVLGINLLKFMRLDAGVSYRYAPGIQLPKTNSNLLNGFNTNISLKFGRF